MVWRSREVGGGELLVVDGEGGGAHSVSVWGDAVETGAADFGDESVAAEFGDEAGGAGASSAAFVVGGWRSWVEAIDEVPVAEAQNGVPSGQYGSDGYPRP